VNWLSLVLALVFVSVWYTHDRRIEFLGIGHRLTQFAIRHPRWASRLGLVVDEWGPRFVAFLATAAGLDFVFRVIHGFF
jgi:hypothetical protein